MARTNMAKPEKAFLELVAGCLKVNKPRDEDPWIVEYTLMNSLD